MKTWQPLSGKFTAPNGLVVEPVGSEDALIEMGRHFHNGLMQHHDTWAGLCLRGKRQIFRVLDTQGQMVANGELEVKGGEVRAMFVRGPHNHEFCAGDAEFEAVSAYLGAVNGKAVKLNLEVGREGFANRTPDGLTPWQQALKRGKELMISPFRALILGVDGEVNVTPGIDPDADPVEEMEWLPLTAPYRAAGGYIVEPIGSRSGLRTLGEELENNLIVMHGSYAGSCQRGQTQFAAIYTEQDGIVAIAEFRPVAGQIVPSLCRGRFDGEAPVGAQSAVLEYVAAVNGHRIQTNVGVGASGFLVDGTAAEMNPFAGGRAQFDASPTLGTAMRHGGYGYDGEDDGIDDMYDPDEEDELKDDGYIRPHQDAREPVADPVTWTALTDRFTASNGLVVEPVSDQEALRQMGVEFNNALSLGHRHWADQCRRGYSQIVRILDASGTMVANAEVHSYGGQVKPEFNRAMHNVPASMEANVALDEWCDAVNQRRIALNGTVTERGFEFEAPGPDMRM